LDKFDSLDRAVSLLRKHQYDILQFTFAALGDGQFGLGRRIIVLRRIDIALGGRAVDQQAGWTVEDAFGECKLRFYLSQTLHRRDQIGLRVNDLRTVDFEQRIAVLDVIVNLGDQSRDAAGEWGQHDRACVFIECNLADRRPLNAKEIKLHGHNVELARLLVGDADVVAAVCRLGGGLLRGKWPATREQQSERKRGPRLRMSGTRRTRHDVTGPVRRVIWR
jgi:hypothetical protein